jgi:hypothetical protein
LVRRVHGARAVWRIVAAITLLIASLSCAKWRDRERLSPMELRYFATLHLSFSGRNISRLLGTYMLHCLPLARQWGELESVRPAPRR